MENYSLADIRAATGGDDMFGNNSAWWILILFFLMGNGGWGNRNLGERVATTDDVQRGFDTQSILGKLDGITNGICDGFYAVNSGMKDGFYGIQGALAENRFASQQCCCETNRNIDAVRYEGQRNTCEITTAIHAEGEATRALLKDQENQRIRDELAQARDIISNTNQSRYILGQLGRFYTNPPCSGYAHDGCGGCWG